MKEQIREIIRISVKIILIAGLILFVLGFLDALQKDYNAGVISNYLDK